TSPDGVGGPETLKLQRAGDAASKVTIASDTHDWDVSPDAARWFWLSTINGTGQATLKIAPFPSGANPIEARARVVDYDIAPFDGKTVVVLTIDHTLIAIADPIAAAGELMLDTEVQKLLSFGALGHIAYTKHVTAANIGDLFVARADGSEACVVEPTSQVPLRAMRFVPNGGAILWARPKGNGYEARYTRLRDCQTTPIAGDVTLLESIGNQRVLFMDQFDPATI